MKTYRKISLILSLLLTTATNLSAATQSEIDALKALYVSTDGDNWLDNTNWNVGDPCSNNWSSVECTLDDANVIGLHLGEDGLTGTIPAEIGNLTNLKELWLYANQLTGSIPPEIGNLTNVTQLSLSRNQLTGSIPTTIGDLTSLNELWLYDNELTGTIPTTIGNLTNLITLSLHTNQLTGAIPTEVGNLSNLTVLRLYDNELTGTIPTTIGNLTNLIRLSLYDNQLTGSIPSEIGNLTSLTYLGLSSNQLTGGIPSEIGNLTNLNELYLYGNEFTGTIPTTIGTLTNLTDLSIGDNQLTGTIPVEIGNLSNLTELKFHENQLTGAIPAGIWSLTSLTELKLYDNYLSGEIPSSITQLTALDDNEGLNLRTNCNLYSNDTGVQAFIVEKSYYDSYEEFAETQGYCIPEPSDTSDIRTVADVNGDGMVDLIGFGTNGVGVSISNGYNFSAGGTWASNFGYDQGWDSTKHLRKMADVNGDGMLDVVGFGNGGVSVALSDGSGFENATQWVNDFGYDQGWRLDKGLRLLADVNGDGKADIIAFGNAGVSVALSDGSSFANAQRWVNDFGYDQNWRNDLGLRMMADVNGDGKEDIVAFGNHGVSVALSNGNSFVNAQRWVDDFGYNQGWRNNKGLRYLSDVNGDGKADIVAFGNAGVSVALSGGNSFVNAQRWVDNFGYDQGWRNDIHRRYMQDVNGDGKEDIVGFGSNGVSIALSDGTSFANDQRWIDDFGINQGWSNTHHLRLMTDVNGDGLMDIVGFGNGGVSVATSLGHGFSSASLWINEFGDDQGWDLLFSPYQEQQ